MCVKCICMNVCEYNGGETNGDLHFLVEQELANGTVRAHHLVQGGDLSGQLSLSIVLLLQIDTGQVVGKLFGIEKLVKCRYNTRNQYIYYVLSLRGNH